MIPIHHTLSSILVLLGACDGAVLDAPSASISTHHGTISSAASLSSRERPAPPGVEGAKGQNGPGAAKTLYVCPMHPEVTSETPGLCPKCNMKLDPKPGAAEVRQAEVQRDASNSP